MIIPEHVERIGLVIVHNSFVFEDSINRIEGLVYLEHIKNFDIYIGVVVEVVLNNKENVIQKIKVNTGIINNLEVKIII